MCVPTSIHFWNFSPFNSLQSPKNLDKYHQKKKIKIHLLFKNLKIIFIIISLSLIIVI